MTCFSSAFVGLLASATLLLGVPARAQSTPDVEWPKLTDVRAVGGGEKDAALVAVVEKYTYVAPVPGARANGEAWFEYFTRGRGIPVERVAMLRDQQVTVGKLQRMVREAAKSVQPGGTLWFVFIGHGAPAKDGSDGLLVGADAQQEADSLFERSVAQGVLLKELAGSAASQVVAVIDACFSGRLPDGKPIVPGLQPLILKAASTLDPKTILLTAAAGDEFAGPLPGAARPAFSYLILGGLRGWADADGSGTVTPLKLREYSARVLRALARDRSQTPSLQGSPGAALGPAWEKGPDLISLVRRYGDAQAEAPRSELAKVPELSGALSGGLKLTASIDALEAYDGAMKAEKSGAPRERAQAWAKLALVADNNPYRTQAAERAKQWQEHAERQEAQWKSAQEQAATLARSLRLSVLTEDQKFSIVERFARDFGAHEGAWSLLVRALAGAAGAIPEQRMASLYERACKERQTSACRLVPAAPVAPVREGLGTWAAACDARQPDGCHRLGLAHLQGEGVAVDVAAAHRAFERACNLGGAKGCYQLANLQVAGQGTSQDTDRALGSYDKACKLGEPLACYSLGLVYAHGQGASADPPRAAAYFTSACRAGEPRSCAGLADLYDAGSGVPRSPERARELRAWACGRGYSPACAKP